MQQLIKTNLGRLRIIGFLEGLSLLVLIFIAVPMKYLLDNPSWTKAIGPVHGALFLLYILNTLIVAIEHNWIFQKTTWKVLIACFIPFGTIYIDHQILSKVEENQS